MNQIIAKKIKNILRIQLGVEEDKIKPEAKIADDLGADSLDTVELIMAFEDEFNIVIPEEEAEKILTVKELSAYLERKIKKEEEIARNGVSQK